MMYETHWRCGGDICEKSSVEFASDGVQILETRALFSCNLQSDKQNSL